MTIARRPARSVRATSPGTLAAWRALPAQRRARVRALVMRRGYPLDRAMDIPPDWLESHILYGYTYRHPWHPLKTIILVVALILIVFALFSVFWRS